MGRLKSLPPAVPSMPARFDGRLPETVAQQGSSSPEQRRSRYRDVKDPWRAWYKTARWQKLRLAVLTRDNWTCCKTGELLIGKHPADNSPVADHIVPHRGDPVLFWDIDNIQTVSKAYHDSEKQRLERQMPGF